MDSSAAATASMPPAKKPKSGKPIFKKDPKYERLVAIFGMSLEDMQSSLACSTVHHSRGGGASPPAAGSDRYIAVTPYYARGTGPIN